MAIKFSMSQNTFLKNQTTLRPYKQESNIKTSCLQANLIKTQPAEDQLTNGDIQQQSNCNCTNISVMQLFHEMKQEFPTIPDYIINQHVIDNCHDRENCKARLQNEINCQLVPFQTYPAQLLSILNKNSMCKNRKQPINTVLSNETKHCSSNINSNSSKHLPKINNKVLRINEAVNPAKHKRSNLSEGAQAQATAPAIEDMRSGLCNIQIKTYLVDQPPSNQFLDVFEKEPSQQLPAIPQRPTTLHLNQEPYSKDQWFAQNKADLNNEQTNNRKSIRKCYSPVLSPSHSHGSPVAPTPLDNGGTRYSTSIQSPVSYPDSRTAEISVNVCLSPSSYRNRNPPQRHQSTINVRPELPFMRNIEASGPNQKSYTSVNLVLRQPSSSPQTPIDITVGPNLTYSSSSYHAKLGYQNNYHITVTDDGGVFSAFRIRPINYHNPTARHINKDLKSESSSFQNSVAKTAHLNEQSDVCKIIMRQHNQMERLSEVLRKNQNKLELVRKEVKYVMQSTNTDGISERLDSEIEKLRCDCQAMLNELENSTVYGLSEDSIEHTNSIKSRQQQPFPKQKPHRFPTPSISANCMRKQLQPSFPLEVVSQQQQSITYHDDDDPSELGD